MTVENVLKILEQQVAPVKVSDDFCKKYSMYDNSGVIINCGKEVNGILFSLDFSEAAVKEAERLGYNLIVTHHPAIYGGINRLDLTANSQARAIAVCISGGISVISMHLNFDAAPNGIDNFLMQGVGGNEFTALSSVDGGFYGRSYAVAPVVLPELVSKINANFSTVALCHGLDGRMVKKVASFCGAGCDDAAVNFAKEQKVDVVVSSDFGHHRILELVESGIAVIQLKHYAAENYGFSRIYKNISGKLQLPSQYFTDGRFL